MEKQLVRNSCLWCEGKESWRAFRVHESLYRTPWAIRRRESYIYLSRSIDIFIQGTHRPVSHQLHQPREDIFGNSSKLSNVCSWFLCVLGWKEGCAALSPHQSSSVSQSNPLFHIRAIDVLNAIIIILGTLEVVCGLFFVSNIMDATSIYRSMMGLEWYTVLQKFHLSGDQYWKSLLSEICKKISCSFYSAHLANTVAIPITNVPKDYNIFFCMGMEKNEGIGGGAKVTLKNIWRMQRIKITTINMFIFFQLTQTTQRCHFNYIKRRKMFSCH